MRSQQILEKYSKLTHDKTKTNNCYKMNYHSKNIVCYKMSKAPSKSDGLPFELLDDGKYFKFIRYVWNGF